MTLTHLYFIVTSSLLRGGNSVGSLCVLFLLSVNKIRRKTLLAYLREILERSGQWERENPLDFRGDLETNHDPGISSRTSDSVKCSRALLTFARWRFVRVLARCQCPLATRVQYIRWMSSESTAQSVFVRTRHRTRGL